MRRLIIYLIALIILFTSCNIPKECSNCFKEARALKGKAYLNEFDSIFHNSFYGIEFSKKFNEGSKSQVIFLEVNLKDKVVALRTNEDSYGQGDFFKQHVISLLEKYHSTEYEEYIIPIIIYERDDRLNRFLEEKDCRFYHKKIERYKKKSKDIGRKFCLVFGWIS